MRNPLKTLILMAGIAISMSAAAHQETELYIPIGQSPGISHVKSWIGRIQSLSAAGNGMTIVVEDRPVYVAFDKTAKIYLQYTAPGQRNQLGTYADCQADRTAEVYVGDDGKLRWIKVQMP
jgi:hypothetical protein